MITKLKFRWHWLLLPLLSGYTAAAAVQSPGTFIPDGNMTMPRRLPAAIRLLNDNVLISSGEFTSGRNISSAELYDPSTASFTAIPQWPANATVLVLLNDGRVLILTTDTTARLYDPSTGDFTITSTRTMSGFGPTTLLEDGRVLILSLGNDAELYDPQTGTFAPTGQLPEVDASTATLLRNGKVLVTFLNDSNEFFNAALYDPSTGIFTRTPDMTQYHLGGTATLLLNGKVLMAGGEENGDGVAPFAELYDPETSTFTPTGNMVTRRSAHTATLLLGGKVLMAGGFGSVPVPEGGFDNTDSAELYDPDTGTFQSTGSLGTGRDGHAATLLSNGEVFIVGGLEYYSCCAGPRLPDGTLSRGELYVPDVTVPAQTVSALQLDPPGVAAGTSFRANVSGSNLTQQTFFDVRFIGPDGGESAVVLNWQKGPAASHAVPAGTAAGIWTINGVRAHQIETDHTGSFVRVSATITVSP